MNLNYTYGDCVKQSIKVRWEIDDVMSPDARLDFDRPFLPQSLAPTELPFLSEAEQRALNHIAGNAYLNLFQFVEEYILAVMMQHAHAELFGDVETLRALTRFVDEELKHQLLFQRFRDAFDRDFGAECKVLENAAEVAQLIMSHSPMAILLITLHIEWMTQRHYTACVRDNVDLDAFFKSLLHHHWLEESQHARIDALELQKLNQFANTEQREKAVVEYLGILDAFDGLLKGQAEHDVESMRRKTERTFDDSEAAAITATQLSGYRRTFVWHGMTHPKVVDAITALSAEQAQEVAARAGAFA